MYLIIYLHVSVIMTRADVINIWNGIELQEVMHLNVFQTRNSFHLLQYTQHCHHPLNVKSDNATMGERQ